MTEEGGGALASVVHVADPKTAVQLVRGFHAVEQNAWRWTTGRFSLTLRAPAGAAEAGATLVLKFAVPDVIIDRLKAVTVTAVVNGRALPPETYSKPGEHTFSRAVPPEALAAEAVPVDFSLDKFLPPGAAGDSRELGIIVTTIGLEGK
jgi:hypothetical protein